MIQSLQTGPDVAFTFVILLLLLYSATGLLGAVCHKHRLPTCSMCRIVHTLQLKLVLATHQSLAAQIVSCNVIQSGHLLPRDAQS